MIIKRKYNFLIERKYIRFRVKWNHNTSIISFNIPFQIDKERWSTETMRCKNNTTHNKIPASRINAELNRYETAAEELFLVYERENKMPVKQEYRQKLEAALGIRCETDNTRFFSRLDEYIRLKTNSNIEDSTRSSIISSFKRIKEWGNELLLCEINENTMQQLVNWLAGRQYNNSTISNTITEIKSYSKWLTKHGVQHGSFITDYKITLKGAENKEALIYLTWDELMKVTYMELQSRNMEEIRDMYCFCCFTSMRFSDVTRLRTTDISNGKITFVTKKTSKPLVIELNKHSDAIYNKYKDMLGNNGLLFPKHVKGYVNSKLREIGKLAGITATVNKVTFIGNERKEQVYEKWELLTFHSSRRTFIVNAIAKGIPIPVIMKWSGHSRYDAMRPYIAIVDELKRDAMRKFDED